ncbi:MAG TPA: HEAT repeat domain-containing protein, partial [Blastocatellia bacterium]|nr:HEAT repeat domain-containing protein [Blastocatellia bacterium]
MLLIVLTLSLPATALAGSSGQELEKLNRFVQASSSSDSAAVKALREGRDLIEDEEFSKAAAVFSEFIRAYPSDKNVDAALYYLAFSQKKMAKYQESVATLQRLLNEHSKSSWINDAKAMKIEVDALLGNREALEDELNKADTEIKSIALQGLFQNNPDRAAEVAAEILKPDSKASRRLKENALNMLGQYRGKQSSAIFLDVARRNTDMKLRRSAIYWLGRTGDETILNGLRDMAVTSTEREISRAALGAIAQQSGTRPNEILVEIARTAPNVEVRKAAVQWLGQRSGEVIVDELMKVYT